MFSSSHRWQFAPHVPEGPPPSDMCPRGEGSMKPPAQQSILVEEPSAEAAMPPPLKSSFRPPVRSYFSISSLSRAQHMSEFCT